MRCAFIFPRHAAKVCVSCALEKDQGSQSLLTYFLLNYVLAEYERPTSSTREREYLPRLRIVLCAGTFGGDGVEA